MHSVIERWHEIVGSRGSSKAWPGWQGIVGSNSCAHSFMGLWDRLNCQIIFVVPCIFAFSALYVMYFTGEIVLKDNLYESANYAFCIIIIVQRGLEVLQAFWASLQLAFPYQEKGRGNDVKISCFVENENVWNLCPREISGSTQQSGQPGDACISKHGTPL